jgi:hypothetical protein
MYHLSSRIRFLTDAAHLLAATATQTSANLAQTRNQLLIDGNQFPDDGQRQKVCSCCGHIFLLGARDVLDIQSIVRPRRRQALTRAKKVAEAPVDRQIQTYKVITCGHCGRYTRVALQPPKPLHRQPSSKALHMISARESQPRSIQNAGSKRRAKARKAGLQALLQQSKDSTFDHSIGLSLADFAKK